jgi:hypothetical protein
MDAPGHRSWFLRKHDDGTVFGPLSFEQLARWAWSAQVAPHDSISTDQENWIKAPMLPELGMDWIVEVTSERLYGPTTLGAIREFIRLGEIDDDTFLINACKATRQRIREMENLLATDVADEQPGNAQSGPTPSGMSIAVEDRIRQLEEALREERRAVAALEEQNRELQTKHRQLVDAAPAPRTTP